jgi:hypothetical protein
MAALGGEFGSHRSFSLAESSSDRSSSGFADDSSHSEPERQYSLQPLRELLARKGIIVKSQFVTSDNTVAFVKILIESIGESILVYFPSKYLVPREDSLPVVDIVPYDLTDEDKALLNLGEEQETREAYNELIIDDLKDKDSLTSESYVPLSLNNNKEHQIRKALFAYHNQLENFKRSTAHIKYKFAVLTNNSLSIINRHNETESYIVKGQTSLILPVVDSKSETLISIPHEFYILIDLPSFFEKLDQVSTEVISVYRNWYFLLNRAHTKQLALAEHRFKNYQLLVQRLLSEYNKNSKFLDLIGTLTIQMEKSVEQENQLIQKLEIINRGQSETMSTDQSKSFKLNKVEQDLVKIREVKRKTGTLLREIKVRYNSFLLTFDSTMGVLCKNLRQMESAIGELGLKIGEVSRK